jgi:hypothetical protein
MTDHNSVKEAETAAAGKVSELTEAVIRTLLQQRAEQQQPPRPYVPSPGDAALFNSFYQQYRNYGVDDLTARDAAADAAIGLGSKDSPAMARAEEQAIAYAQQQAQEYRSVTAIAVNPDTPLAVQQQANARRKTIEGNLGITNQSLEVKAKTINGLDPHGQPPRQALQTSYQAKLQQNGVSPKTAAAASKALTNGKGAGDSPPIAQAHREIHQHHVLKHMYQGVFERHHVSPEVASQAADQLARGNGANRSVEVSRAHSQALANIEYTQQRPSAQTPNSVAKENNAAYATEAARVEKPSTQVDHASVSSSTQRLWDTYSGSEHGVFESMAKGDHRVQQMSDQLVAQKALLAGENPKDVQRAIAQHSPHAQELNGPDSYASRTVEKAEHSSEVKEKRAKEKVRDTRPSRKAAQRNQANHQTRSATKDKPKQKKKSRDRGMSY